MGLGKMAYIGYYWSHTAGINVLLSFTFSVVFYVIQYISISVKLKGLSYEIDFENVDVN